ncbi:hypothetical protein [Zobellia russellii]|uniref:hypothetical protein n=1 Tax=Zobellia russellii TaxID=248907 RepID=UPI0037DC3BF9
MTFEEIDAKIKRLEKNIITDFEERLIYKRLEDFYEVSSDYDTRVPDEFYYMELLIIDEDEVISLLDEIRYCDKTFHSLQYRLIKLKRIIDNRLANTSEELITIDSRKQRRISHFQLDSSINIKDFTDNLYGYLRKYHFIECLKDEFQSIFERGETKFKIKWLGTELELTSLINKLIEYNLLEKETHSYKYHLIAKYFINKRNNQFKEKQLSSVYSEKKDSLSFENPINMYFEN